LIERRDALCFSREHLARAAAIKRQTECIQKLVKV